MSITLFRSTVCAAFIFVFCGVAGAAGMSPLVSIEGTFSQMTGGKLLLAQSDAAPPEASSARPGRNQISPVPPKSGSAQAQSCPAPDAGEGYCGYYGGWCRYCDTAYPHYCPSNDTCYKYFTEAQKACGNNYVICGAAQ